MTEYYYGFIIAVLILCLFLVSLFVLILILFVLCEFVKIQRISAIRTSSGVEGVLITDIHC